MTTSYDLGALKQPDEVGAGQQHPAVRIRGSQAQVGLERIARLRGTTVAEIGEATGRNATDLFRLNHAG